MHKRLFLLTLSAAAIAGCQTDPVTSVRDTSSGPALNTVASPHTKSDLRHIQELKKKQGIDYDSHASYRFVERK